MHIGRCFRHIAQCGRLERADGFVFQGLGEAQFGTILLPGIAVIAQTVEFILEGLLQSLALEELWNLRAAAARQRARQDEFAGDDSRGL